MFFVQLFINKLKFNTNVTYSHLYYTAERLHHTFVTETHGDCLICHRNVNLLYDVLLTNVMLMEKVGLKQAIKLIIIFFINLKTNNILTLLELLINIKNSNKINLLLENKITV